MLSYLLPPVLQSLLPVFTYACKNSQPWWERDGAISYCLRLTDGMAVLQEEMFGDVFMNHSLEEIIHPVFVCCESRFHAANHSDLSRSLSRVICDDGQHWLVLWPSPKCPEPIAYPLRIKLPMEPLLQQIASFSELLQA